MAYDAGLTNLIATQPIRLQELANQTRLNNATVANTQQETRQNQLMQPYKIQGAAQTVQGNDIDIQKKKLDMLSSLVYGVVDQPSYEAALNQYKNMGGDTSQFGQTYNPQQIDQVKMGLATATARLNAMVSMSHQKLQAGLQGYGDPSAAGWDAGLGPPAAAPSSSSVPTVGSDSALPQVSATGPGMALPVGDTPNPPPAYDIPATAADTGQPPAAGPALSPQANPVQIANTPIQIMNDPRATKLQREMAAKQIGTVPAGSMITGNGVENIPGAPDAAGEMKRAEAGGGKLGDQQKDTSLAATTVTQSVDRTLEALNGMEALIKSGQLPEDSAGLNAAKQAWISQNAGAVLSPDMQKRANAYAQFQQLNETGVIQGLSSLTSSGAIRGNQTIENIVKNGYAVPEGLNSQGKIDIIGNLRNEIKNTKISAQNISNSVNGGDQQPMLSATGAGNSIISPANVPSFKGPDDPEFQKLPAGSKFIDSTTGQQMVKH